MLKYSQARLPDGRYGIFVAGELLASIGSVYEARRLVRQLNLRSAAAESAQVETSEPVDIAKTAPQLVAQSI